MTLDLCVPARNEAPFIQQTILKLVNVLRPTARSVATDGATSEEVDWKIVVSVNGSTDNTLEKVLDIQRSGYSKFDIQEKVEVLDCPTTGKGSAIKFAAQNSQADIFGFIDADLSTDPDSIPEMVSIIQRGEADIVIASRLLQSKTTNRSSLRSLSSRIFNLGAKLILGLKVKDAQCGLKFMDVKGLELLKQCKEDGWFLDMEFLYKTQKRGLRIVEIPVPWIEFRYSDRKSQIRHLRDGAGALAAMFRIRAEK